jgi:hypothetical protein
MMTVIRIYHNGIKVDNKFISVEELRSMNTKFSIRMLNEILIKNNIRTVNESRPWVLNNKYIPIRPRVPYSSPRAKFYRF